MNISGYFNRCLRRRKALTLGGTPVLLCSAGHHMISTTDSIPRQQSAAASPLRPVLMIAFHFPPSTATGARRPFRFARYLRDYGYLLHVITQVPQSSPSPWKHTTQAPGSSSIPRRVAIGSKAAKILQRFLPYNDQLPWVAHAVETATHVIARERPVAIISTSPPIACHLAAWLCSRWYGLPWIADFRDPLYGNPSRNRSWGWIWDAPVDRLIISKAAAVIANTDAAADMLRTRYPRMAHKIHLVWNGYDPEQIIGPLPLPKRSYRLLVHAGSLYGQRHPTALLASLHRLISSGKLNSTQLKIRLVGELYENDRWIAESKFSELIRLGCVEHTAGAVTADEAVREMAESDYLLLLDLNDRNIGLQVPAKIFEYIRIGRPILAFTGRNSPVERILSQSGIRHICLHGDSPAEEIDRQLLSLLDLPPMPLKPSAWFEEQFNGAKQSEALARILDEVLRCSPVSTY